MGPFIEKKINVSIYSMFYIINVGLKRLGQFYGISFSNIKLIIKIWLLAPTDMKPRKFENVLSAKMRKFTHFFKWDRSLIKKNK